MQLQSIWESAVLFFVNYTIHHRDTPAKESHYKKLKIFKKPALKCFHECFENGHTQPIQNSNEITIKT